jgi:peptidoglycan-associated lipoprotein
MGAVSEVGWNCLFNRRCKMAQMNVEQIKATVMAGMRHRSAIVLIAVCALSVLAACSTPIKLDEVAVEDRNGKAVGSQPLGGTAGTGGTTGATGPIGSAGVNGVAGADVSQRAIQAATADGVQASASGPANTAKIIYFDYDSYAIRPEFQAAIDSHAKFLNTYKTRKLAIEGHTDERGGREYNLALGQKRSEAVRRALGLLGVTESQIEAVSFGKEKPATTGADEPSMALNRRAEINYR